MQSKTIAILWVGSIIVAAGLGYEGARRPSKLTEKLVYTEGKVVYRDRVITKTKEYGPTGKISKEITVFDDKSKKTTDGKLSSDKTQENAKAWGIAVDYGLNNFVSGSLERRIIGPFSVRAGLNMFLTPTPKIGDITPFVGIKFEF